MVYCQYQNGFENETRKYIKINKFRTDLISDKLLYVRS